MLVDGTVTWKKAEAWLTDSIKLSTQGYLLFVKSTSFALKEGGIGKYIFVFAASKLHKQETDMGMKSLSSLRTPSTH